jgi:hypothetical protein
MEVTWTLADFHGYLRTWSATRRYVDARGEDPILLVEKDLSRAWGPPDRPRSIVWDLALRVGRKT